MVPRGLTAAAPPAGFAFSNVEAAADFEEQRARFFSEHERFDDYMEMREGLDLSGVPCFRELVVAYRGRKPWYFRPAVFWAASLLLLSWPVRLLQEYNTAHVHYQVGNGNHPLVNITPGRNCSNRALSLLR